MSTNRTGVLALTVFLSVSTTMVGTHWPARAAAPLPFAATVSLGNPTQDGRTQMLKNNDSVQFVCPVATSADVPGDGSVTVKVDFIEIQNSTGIQYTVNPPSRTKTKPMTGGGQAVNYGFTVATTSQNTGTGTLGFRFVIDTVVGATAIAPMTKDVTIAVVANTDCGCLETQICFAGQCISPVVVDPSGDGFNLTGPTDGVAFDITGAGNPMQISWTAAGSDDAWLALDRNGNGTIDGGQELFGNFSPQPDTSTPNGFIALGVYDKFENGGNGDGYIDSSDTIFPSLWLWQDSNHNGVSEASELKTVPQLGISRFDLDYKVKDKTDANGNIFKYRAKVFDTQGAQVGRWAWDVYLQAAP